MCLYALFNSVYQSKANEYFARGVRPSIRAGHLFALERKSVATDQCYNRKGNKTEKACRLGSVHAVRYVLPIVN